MTTVSSSPALPGGSITQWDDKSGNARHATNAGTGTPLLSTSIINGIPAIQFNDGNFLATPSFTMNTLTRTAFVVYRHTASTFPADGVFYNFEPLIGVSGNGFQLFTVRLNTSPYQWRAGLGITNVGFFPEGPAYFSGNTQPATPNFLICAQRTTASTGVITYNGTPQTTTFTNTSSQFPATDVLRVGRTRNSSGVPNVAGNHIGEILLYNAALSTIERQQVEGYLAHKWGLQGSLPTSHPYRSIKP
jgi:hypothetical protein